MEPVISPWVFYLAGIGDIREAFGFPGGLLLLAGCILLAARACYKHEGDIPTSRAFGRWAMLVFPLGLLLSFTAIAIPSKATVYQMLIASSVTHERVAQGEKAIKQIYDDILKRVDKALDDKK